MKYPVILISFSGGINSKADLEEDLIQILDANEERLGLECTNKSKSKAKYYLAELIKKASQKYQQKVVILIDEYPESRIKRTH